VAILLSVFFFEIVMIVSLWFTVEKKRFLSKFVVAFYPQVECMDVKIEGAIRGLTLKSRWVKQKNQFFSYLAKLFRVIL